MSVKICPNCNGRKKCPRCRGKGCKECLQTGMCLVCAGVGTVPDGDYYSGSWLAGRLEKRGKKIYD